MTVRGLSPLGWFQYLDWTRTFTHPLITHCSIVVNARNRVSLSLSLTTSFIYHSRKANRNRRTARSTNCCLNMCRKMTEKSLVTRFYVVVMGNIRNVRHFDLIFGSTIVPIALWMCIGERCIRSNAHITTCAIRSVSIIAKSTMTNAPYRATPQIWVIGNEWQTKICLLDIRLLLFFISHYKMLTRYMQYTDKISKTSIKNLIEKLFRIFTAVLYFFFLLSVRDDQACTDDRIIVKGMEIRS